MGVEPAMTTPTTRIGVLVVEDEHLVRAALLALLRSTDDITVVADLACADDVREQARASGADVAVLDGELPGCDVIHVTLEIQTAAPRCRTIIVSSDRRPMRMREVLAGGAWGFLTTAVQPAVFLDAVRRVAAGEHVADPTIAADALTVRPSPLTPREREVLTAASQGLYTVEIAAHTFLSEGTVRNYLSSAITKTGTRNRIEAARVAFSNGWI